MGYYALEKVTTRAGNVAFSHRALTFNNICISNEAGQLMNSALSNIYISETTSYNLATSINNILISQNAGYVYNWC
jgi:hypothetical protein